MKRTNTAVWEEKYNRWKINVQKDGRRKSFYSSIPGRNGQREANKKADAWLDGDLLDIKSRVDGAYAQFEESIISKDDKKDAQKYGRLYILPDLATRKVHSLIEDDFQTILDKAAVKGASGKPLSKKTLTKLAHIMRNFMRFCRRKKIATETLEFLVVPKNAYTRQKRILQPKDLLILFDLDTTILRGKRVKEDYIHAYRLAVLTGLRPGELLGMERGDIHGREIRLQRAVNQEGEITTGKNENARRSFILTDLAKKELDLQLTLTDGARIFGIESQSTYRHRWKRYCEANEIPYVSPYEIRHTFVSMCKGLSDGEIKALVGHSKDMDTWGIYGHEVQGEQERIAGKLQNIISGILQSEEKSK